MENLFTYEVVTSNMGSAMIKRTDSEGNEAWIPTEPGNSDYATYCVWAIAEGLMEAPEVVEPEVVEPVAEPVIGADPEPEV